MAKLSVDRDLRRAKVCELKGASDQAIAIYSSILKRFPDNARARDALGALLPPASRAQSVQDAALPQDRLNGLIALCRKGDFSTAANEAARLAGQYPSSFQLWHILGVANHRLRRVDEAERCFGKAAELEPENPSALNNHALTLAGLGKFEQAAGIYRRALEIDPDFAEAHNNLGNVLKDLGRLDEALGHCQHALRIKPDFAEARMNLANLLKELGRSEEAVATYRQALRLKPDFPEVHNNLGLALKQLGSLGEAESEFRQALEARPAYAEAHYNLGNLLRERERLDEAVESFRRALEIQPGNEAALAQKLRQQLMMCDWSALEEFASVRDRLGVAGKAVTPFALLPFEDEPERQAERARYYARQSIRREPLPLPARAARHSGKIRLGYFTADFHDHPMLYLMAGMFREHDRSRFEIFVYSYGPKHVSKMREKVLPYIDHFFEIGDMSDRSVVELARNHGIDIAIDRKGYTHNSRSRLFSWRLAPVQINYLAYPGTMGADFIDYIVADPVVIPEAERRHFDEKIIYLPNCYQPNDNEREIAETSTNRSDFGLPEDCFVFCCFNQNYKIGPREFDIWMRLLEKVEGSVLWLLRSNRWVEANLRREAEARGIAPERLVFAEKLPHAEHLARHKHADLFVDTFNYNAHTTASDALWAGMPVVTRIGRQFAARVSASLLTAIGLPELIAGTEADYEALILDLATNPDSLAAIQAKLAENRLTQPLFDTVRYTRDFEAALEAAYRETARGG